MPPPLIPFNFPVPLTNVHFPVIAAVLSLAAKERMRFVGNTMIDTLVALEERIRERGAAESLGFRPGSYLLVTLHRPALVDGPLLGPTMERLSAVGQELPVLFPVHPRTRKMLDGATTPGSP